MLTKSIKLVNYRLYKTAAWEKLLARAVILKVGETLESSQGAQGHQGGIDGEQWGGEVNKNALRKWCRQTFSPQESCYLLFMYVSTSFWRMVKRTYKYYFPIIITIYKCTFNGRKKLLILII